MSLTLGTNLLALKALKGVNDSSRALEGIFERLSSGQRINRASDDAAGLAVADSLRADARLARQASRNVNDAISLTNIYESALTELGQIVERQKVLAAQAANGNLSSSQREVLDLESKALTSEYNRIVGSTEFNGRNLFDPTDSQFLTVVGSGAQNVLSTELNQEILRKVSDGIVESSSTSAIQMDESQLIDIDGDGDLDVIGLVDNSSFVHRFTVRLNNGDGTFAGTQSYGQTAGVGNDFAVGDLNGDGNLDLIYDTNNLQIGWVAGNGDGTFGGMTFISSAATGDNTPLELTDLDGDGNLDLLRLDPTGSVVRGYLGNGNGTFGAAQTLTAAGGTGTTMQLVDVNNDGVNDIVVGADDRISVSLGSSDGTFSAFTSMSSPSIGENRLVVADIDQDGNLDIISGDYLTTNEVYIRYGSGDGSFSSVETYEVDGVFSSLVSADFNSDGLIDVAAAGSSTLYLLEQNEQGTFQIGENFGSSNFLNGSHEAADLNGDGVVDLVSAGASGESIELFGTEESATQPFRSIRSEEFALEALTALEEQSDEISLELGRIGAFQSRLAIAGRTLDVRALEYEAAESRIRDVDIASEVAELVRQQVLQQSATALLAQANQAPQLVLQLLDSLGSER